MSLTLLLVLGVISLRPSSAQNGTTSETVNQTQSSTTTSTETMVSSVTATLTMENHTQSSSTTSALTMISSGTPTSKIENQTQSSRTTSQMTDRQTEGTTATEEATGASNDVLEKLSVSPTLITNGTAESPDVDWVWEPIIWTWWLGIRMISVILGLIGNFLVILVLLQRRKNTNTGDALIGNLATADFLTSLFLIPLPRATRVPMTVLGELYCRIIFPSSLLWTCILSSNLTLMAISLERYLIIVHPTKSARWRKHKYLCIALIWTITAITNLYIPLTRRVNIESKACKSDFVSIAGGVTLGVFSFAICYAIPLVVMVVTNVTAALKMQRQFRLFNTKPQGGARSNESMSKQRLVATNRLLRLLILVIIIFAICWGPNSVAFLLFSLRVLDSSYLYGPVDRIMVLLAFFNSCANPIVYTLCYPQFRKALRN